MPAVHSSAALTAEVLDRSPPNLYEMYIDRRSFKRAHRNFNRLTRLEMPARRTEIVDRLSPNNHMKVYINKKCYLSGYCTAVHQIFTRCSCIIAGVNALVQTAILHSICERLSKD